MINLNIYLNITFKTFRYITFDLWYCLLMNKQLMPFSNFLTWAISSPSLYPWKLYPGFSVSKQGDRDRTLDSKLIFPQLWLVKLCFGTGVIYGGRKWCRLIKCQWPIPKSLLEYIVIVYGCSPVQRGLPYLSEKRCPIVSAKRNAFTFTKRIYVIISCQKNKKKIKSLN